MDALPDRGAPAPLTLVERVRCLDCGNVYAKPAGRGTVASNPGCPDCGYVGWLSATIPFTRAGAQSRSDADPHRRRSA